MLAKPPTNVGVGSGSGGKINTVMGEDGIKAIKKKKKTANPQEIRFWRQVPRLERGKRVGQFSCLGEFQANPTLM